MENVRWVYTISFRGKKSFYQYNGEVAQLAVDYMRIQKPDEQIVVGQEKLTPEHPEWAKFE